MIKPVRMSAQSEPKRNGAIPEKSHFDCNVNNVNPANSPNVIKSASSTIIVS
jgi:hypothetical protein